MAGSEALGRVQQLGSNSMIRRERTWNLLRQLVAQELRSRYLGSMLGLAWLVLVPLLTLGLYSVVFGGFMKARWATQEVSGVSSFALVLFPGLLVFNYFAECVNRAPSLVLSNPNYVKKVVFPLPVLGLATALAALVQFFVGLLVWCGLSLWLGHPLTWRIFLVPVVMLPFVALVIGLVWAASAIGVYVRDLLSFAPIVTQVLMFLSPVLYPVENVPAGLRWIFVLNPLTFVVEEVRTLLLSPGTSPFPWWNLAGYACVGAVVALAGLKLFRALRPGFADVI
jgi:lipopolysaccharide transport system permease protein